MKKKLPRSAYNWLSLIGATIATIALFLILFLATISMVFDQGGSYLGLIIYIILPAFMIIGLIVIPIGMWIKHKKIQRGTGGEFILPHVNLNDPRHRNAFLIFSVGTVLLLFMSAIGSYEAFEYTESVEFCGTTCHSVMKPEFVAYQDSPHSRVRCVDCHVGSGVDWYMRSKLSGLRQVYQVTLGTVPKPIETPIHNLRPARETCENCHWPEKFYANSIREENYFLLDEENTEWKIQLMMKVGTNNRANALEAGIHWHINPNTKVEYVHTDVKRQEIPWVRYTNLETGEVKIFMDEDNPIDEAELSGLEIRTMDCMDCHNRPSHNYEPPTYFVNSAMLTRIMPKELPELKSLSMELCGEEYASSDTAMIAIENGIREFYNDNYPEIVEDTPELIDKAVTGLQEVFSKNIFPEMKVRWSAYPLNIGHMEFNGCFRCHSDTHITKEEEVITKDCNLCHGIIAQGSPDSLMVMSYGEFLEFEHPEDIGDEWQHNFCTDCHTGLDP